MYYVLRNMFYVPRTTYQALRTMYYVLHTTYLEIHTSYFHFVRFFSTGLMRKEAGKAYFERARGSPCVFFLNWERGVNLIVSGPPEIRAYIRRGEEGLYAKSRRVVTTYYVLRTTYYVLRTTNYVLRTTNYELCTTY